MKFSNPGPVFRPHHFAPWFRDCIRAQRRDRSQRQKFGPDAPLFAEKINVNIDDIRGCLPSPISRRHSAKVVGSDWDSQIVKFDENPKLAYCVSHWRDGLSWEAAGAVEYHMNMIQTQGHVDGLRSHDEVINRLRKLDEIYAQVLRERMLRPKSATRQPNFRESGGVFVHIDRNGEGIFGLAGNHRLGMAIASKLKTIPAQIGQIHPQALSMLPKLRVQTSECD